MYCIETKDLNYRFTKATTTLRQVDMHVPTGSIYGFLGPNGAGKTTTLRLILGLLKKQTGNIRVFGKNFEQHRVEILRQLGSLIETPSLYSHLTATENLLILQKIYQCPKSRIPELLERVGLSGAGNKKVGKFSLGMKQRLSIAIALLNDPSLLILDEPSNGLDPNGIIEIRELLKRLNRENRISILISSHLLAEIEKLATHVGIIHKGTLLFEGTLQDLVDKQQESTWVVMDTNDNQLSLQMAQKWHPQVRLKDGRLVFPLLHDEQVGALNRALVQAGIDVYRIGLEKNDLEAIFMDLVKS